MPEVRTNLPDQLHRTLKEEAAREGLSLKALLVKIVEEHVAKEKKRRQ